jgi:hypothetical protein
VTGAGKSTAKHSRAQAERAGAAILTGLVDRRAYTDTVHRHGQTDTDHSRYSPWTCSKKGKTDEQHIACHLTPTLLLHTYIYRLLLLPTYVHTYIHTYTYTYTHIHTWTKKTSHAVLYRVYTCTLQPQPTDHPNGRLMLIRDLLLLLPPPFEVPGERRGRRNRRSAARPREFRR